ncbi:MAG: efflux transporter outer membrane subunit [Deltaproteobacteria bacterium]|nr:efflux transporter outer membrane subunit [Deltaproteobacteria bacterium]
MQKSVFKHFHQNFFRNKRGCCRLILAALVIGLLLSGCLAVGPDYVRVEAKAPKTWHTTLQGGLNDHRLTPEALSQWWQVLGDPQLESLEKRAVAGNLELKIARARIREARALRGVSQAELFPKLNATGSISDQRSSENNGLGHESKLYAAGFDAGWELDIFGGRRRALEAAHAEVASSEEDLHDVLVSLLAEVGLNYVEARTFQARLTAARNNIAVQQETYELNLSLHNAGLIDALALEQSLYNLEHSRSQIPGLQTGLEAAKNRLAVLLGKNPGEVHPELAEEKAIPAIPLSLAVGIPAETLRHRPDIRRAERNLAAASARIGVATADLYPKFTLSGSIGLESISAGKLWQWASRSWNIGPSFSWNIFDAGAIRQNIQVQNARQEQALINYENTVLQALEEVENALVAYAKEQQRREALTQATASAQRADLLARDQYQAGLVDFSNVLEAQRSLLLFRDELAQSNGMVTTNLIRLYKALGGGWTDSDAVGLASNKSEKK